MTKKKWGELGLNISLIELHEMKLVLFGVAIAFAALFVLSTMVAFIGETTSLLHGDVNAHLSTSFAMMGVGIMGWIVTTLILVAIDECDGDD